PRGRLEQRHSTGRTAAIASVVVAARDAGRRGGVDELARARQYRRADRNAQRPGGAVRRRVNRDLDARNEPFALLEVRQDLVVAPSARAPIGPGVEVSWMAAHVRHVVDP